MNSIISLSAELRWDAAELLYLQEDLRSENEEYLTVQENYEKRIEAIQQEIDLRSANNPNDFELGNLAGEKEQLQTQFNEFKKIKTVETGKLNEQIQYLKLKRKQVPFLYFMGGIWIVIFGGLVFSCAVSYLGHVLPQTYILRNDRTESYRRSTIRQINEADKKQPRLTATLFIITLLIR